MVAFALGRAGSNYMGRLVGPTDHDRTQEFLRRRGAAAIAMSRPIPIVSETTAIMAGASAKSWLRASLGALVGVAPQAVIYAVVGAGAATVVPGIWAFAIVVALSAAMWLLVPRLT